MKVQTKEFFQIANLLSISRIILAWPIVYLIKTTSVEDYLILVIVTLIAASTDYFDGYFSRKLNQVTELGIVLDPIADKISMAAIFIALIIYRGFPLPLIVLLLYRDLMIMLIGAVLIKDSGHPVMANIWGKLNTSVIALAGLLFILPIPGIIVNVLIIISYATILISGVSYAQIGQQMKFNTPGKMTLYWGSLLVLTLIVVWLIRDFNFII